MTFPMLLSMLMILLSIISVIRHLIRGLASELESDLRDTVDWDKKWLVDFSAGKTQLVSFDRSSNNGSIDVKMDRSALEEKSSFKMLDSPSPLNWTGTLTLSLLLKLPPRNWKTGALIHSMKFLSPEIAL